MTKTSKMQLKTSRVMNIPIDSYEKDFTFIVNGEEIKTSRIVSDLLSPAISQLHKIDATIDSFVINTRERGDFSTILKLVEFKKQTISSNEISFIEEIIEILNLDKESISIELEESPNAELTKENVLKRLLRHEKHRLFFSELIEKEIEFISTHFYEVFDGEIEEIKDIEMCTICDILTRPGLQMKNEDQLLKIINKLYLNDNKFSILYEFVYFENVSKESMEDFINTFNMNDMTMDTWNRLTKRLLLSTERKEKENDKSNRNIARYKIEEKPRGTKFSLNKENEFSGILNYFQTQTQGKIEQEVNITSSDNKGNPQNVVLYNNQNKYFNHYNEKENWICFDFKEHRVIPTEYTIRSIEESKGWDHPKNWVIEGSIDNKSWTTIDEETDCPHLNGPSLVHTFTIQAKNQTQNPPTNEFRYIRMRSTGLSWANYHYLSFESFEVYGTLI